MIDLIEKARKFAALAEKATPGPWKVMGDKKPLIGVESDPTLGKHGKVVIDGDCDGRRVWLNAKKVDLHLCAAAPEMAKLLGEMADRLERYEKESG